ncbi:MAG TPA: glutathione S-transferase family protein [Stellaceae bacterium]|nr:glutathione S-transferase family protein [Stellaceae bacterium]
MIDIYYWLTDNGRKALQMIEETGLPHRKVPVNLTKKEQFAPEFLKISPGHKIPALADDDGPGGTRIALCESGAILKYLSEKAGGALYPAAPAARALTDQWFFYGTSTFTPHAQQYGLFMHRFGEDVPPAKKHYAEQLHDMFGILDRQLATGDYLAGAYSIADIACYPDVHLHGKLGMGLDPYPNLNRWHDAIAARPAVQRAWAVNS